MSTHQRRWDLGMIGLLIVWLYWSWAVATKAHWLTTFDHHVALTLHHTPQWFQSLMIPYTLIGNPHNITIVIIVIGLLLIIFKQTKGAVFFWVNSAGLAAYGNYLVKQVITRPRPTAWRLTDIGGYSYPSGHATTTTVLIGSLLVLAYDLLKRPNVKRGLLGIGLVLIGLMLVSRVVVGVHYPSDVLGGAMLGSLLLYASTRLTAGHRTGKFKFHQPTQ